MELCGEEGTKEKVQQLGAGEAEGLYICRSCTPAAPPIARAEESRQTRRNDCILGKCFHAVLVDSTSPPHQYGRVWGARRDIAKALVLFHEEITGELDGCYG